VRKVMLVLKEHKVLLALKVLKEHKDSKEFREQSVHKVR
jgi:hypothetical protein